MNDSSTSSVKTMAGMTVLSGVLSTLVSIHRAAILNNNTVRT